MAGGAIQEQVFDHIKDDATKGAVQAHFERMLSRDDLKKYIHEDTKMNLAKLREKLDELNAGKTKLDEFVAEVVVTIQENKREHDLHEGYVDKGGAAKPGYLEQFIALVGMSGSVTFKEKLELKAKYEKDTPEDISWKDQQAFDECLNRVKAAVETVPAGVDPEVRHEFVNFFIHEYAQAIKNSYRIFGIGYKDFDLNKAYDADRALRQKVPAAVNFEAWLKIIKGKELPSVMVSPEKADFAGLDHFRISIPEYHKKIISYDDSAKTYYNGLLKNIEEFVKKNPADLKGVSDQITALDKELEAYDKFIAFKDDIGKLKTAAAGLNSSKSELGSALDKMEIEYNSRAAKLASASPEERAKTLDVGTITGDGKTKDTVAAEIKKTQEATPAQADAGATGMPSEAGADTGETPSVENGLVDMFLTKMDPRQKGKLEESLKGISAKVPMLGAFLLSFFIPKSILTKHFNFKSGDIPDDTSLDGLLKTLMPPGTVTPDKTKAFQERATQVLKNKFHIGDQKPQEILTLSNRENNRPVVSLNKFLNECPAGFPEAKYQQIKTALKANGAEQYLDASNKTVMEFIVDRLAQNTWKDV